MIDSPTQHQSPVLSGDFLAGPIYDFFTSWQQGYTKVWWVPRYLGDPAPRAGNAGLWYVKRGWITRPPYHMQY